MPVAPVTNIRYALSIWCLKKTFWVISKFWDWKKCFLTINDRHLFHIFRCKQHYYILLLAVVVKSIYRIIFERNPKKWTIWVLTFTLLKQLSTNKQFVETHDSPSLAEAHRNVKVSVNDNIITSIWKGKSYEFHNICQ